MNEIYQIKEAQSTVIIVNEVDSNPVIIIQEPVETVTSIVTERNGIDGTNGAIYKSLVNTEFDGNTDYRNTTVQMEVSSGLAWSVGMRARLSKKIAGNVIIFIEGEVLNYKQILGVWYLDVKVDNQSLGVGTYTSGTCYVNISGSVGPQGEDAAPLVATVDSVNGELGHVVLTPDHLDDTLTTNKFTSAGEISKLAGIDAGAEVNNISDIDATDLTDGGDTTLHKHDGRYYTESEMDIALSGKSNTGHTHTASNITDFQATVSSNSDVTSNTSARHTHSNISTLNAITEAFTMALKAAYDGAVSWITTNGSNLINHLSNTANPHSVTKTQVGLGNADNTSDADKPISSATQTALNGKANTSHTHPQSEITNLVTDLAGKAASIHAHAISDTTGLQTALDNKVDENAAITGATKTKITYDAKGLVTGGTDATTADIADSSNRRYVTDAQQTVIGNTSGTNTGDDATNSQYSGLAASKQDVLVSGTNIKTVRGSSILGSGDLALEMTAEDEDFIIAMSIAL